MDQDVIQKKFSQIGTRVKFGSMPERRRLGIRDIPGDIFVQIDVRRDEDGEFFQLDTKVGHNLNVIVPSLDKADRHLLLMIFDKTKIKEKPMRFLCGHDERHYFAAAVPEKSGASSVNDAKEALKPTEVVQAQRGVKTRNRHKRKSRSKNPVVRQGEWFFIPVKNMDVPANQILKNEPISRGQGKPHVCEFVYRVGGDEVYVCPKYPEGVSKENFRKIIARNPDLDPNRTTWEVRARDATVCAKGRITHKDHATIILDDWHKVFPNTESESKAMRFLTFLD